MPKKHDPTDLVTVYPSVHGLFFDGVPAVVQQVDPSTAEAWCLHGTFTRDLPEGYVVATDGRVVWSGSASEADDADYMRSAIAAAVIPAEPASA